MYKLPFKNDPDICDLTANIRVIKMISNKHFKEI